MRRWIVNPKERTVRPQRFDLVLNKPEEQGADEFLYDAPTYADAMAAGQRRRLAEEALSGIESGEASALYAIVSDRIEPRASGPESVYMITDLAVELEVCGFDVWREGTGLVVLGRLP